MSRLDLWPWRLLHLAIVLLLGSEFLYASYQVFFALAPDGSIGPLFGAASELPPDLLLARRLYAIEAWIAFGCLAIYLAITELGPRSKR